MADVTVFGLVAGTCIIEDLRMDVPHGIAVTIPAEKAYSSKDLWRAIQSKQIFQLHNGPYAHGPPVPAPAHGELANLREKVRLLEEENRRLRDMLSAQTAQTQKIDNILSLLQTQSNKEASVVRVAQRQSASAASALVKDDAPVFIPSRIRPDDVVANHVELKSEASTASHLSEAANALRKARGGGV